MAKKYLHEVDMMRVFFIFGVLLNHTTTAFIQQMSSGGAARTALLGSHLLIHFTRMGFMFMTGLVLTLNYYHRHQWGRFFQKRFAGSGWPYLLWNGLYLGLAVLIGAPSYHWATFWSDYADMILHGNAWYMYYILITLQLYLAFPLIVWLFKHVKHHEWLLGISFLLQLSIVTWIKYIMPGVDRSQWLWWCRAYGVNIFTYQFYFMLGAYTSIHYQQVTHLVTAHLRGLTIASVTLGISTIPYYFWNRAVLGLDHTHAVSPHQPYMLVYDTIVILTVFGLGQNLPLGVQMVCRLGLQPPFTTLRSFRLGYISIKP
ncbi:acyltransferase family protein [Lacticaseibacillus manihotivorans]|uniref:acyltransferase family protein n=1 Tax=Lacticaseibacillus manihotivorans TaxID=88233 RepID=UPI000AD4497C|nr:acyltransferase [Lacticaseibacillus manihotivorans]